jgi:hypothetical protein
MEWKAGRNTHSGRSSHASRTTDIGVAEGYYRGDSFVRPPLRGSRIADVLGRIANDIHRTTQRNERM